MRSQNTLLSLALVTVFIFTNVLLGRAATKEEIWIDPNFVPCEGLGAGASGNVGMRVTFDDTGSGVRVTSLQVSTRYGFPHIPSARIIYRKPGGGSSGMNLQDAWFPTIGPDDGSHYLYLPKQAGKDGPKAQTPFEMASGTAIELSVSIQFPQAGGACVAGFDNKLVLP